MPEQTGIQVTTPTFRLLLRVCSKTRIELDNGAEMLRPWGDTFLPAAPGSHKIRCYTRWACRNVGGSTAQVTVPDGAVACAEWQALMDPRDAGKWTISGQATEGRCRRALPRQRVDERSLPVEHGEVGDVILSVDTPGNAMPAWCRTVLWPPPQPAR
jgi:hypothetical protein